MVGIKNFAMPSCCGNCDMRNSVDQCAITYTCIDDDMEKLKDCPLIEAIPKDQYEARLKADMVAILKDLQLAIEEARRFPDDSDFDKGYNRAIDVWKEVIQEKINALKEQEDEP